MKYEPGLMVGQLSGKAGNTVASRNRFGSYFRTRVVPMLVQNSFTTAVRGDLTTLSTRWRTLTDNQRAGWSDLGANMPRTNSLGHVYHLTGLQAYISINRNLLTFGGSIVDDAPADTPPPSALTLTVTATAS